MATSPAFLNPASDLGRSVRRAWLPAVLCIGFICFTSTTLMSGYHTQFVVDDAWKLVFGNWHAKDLPGIVNYDGRKTGHFLGYGAVGLIFRYTWFETLRLRRVRKGGALQTERLLPLSCVLAVLSIFIVSSLDELHQCFLPQRVGSFADVMRDTLGTVFMILVWLAWRAYHRVPAFAPAQFASPDRVI